MKFNLLLILAEKIVDYFWQTSEVKAFVIHLLERYVKSDDNDIDYIILNIIRGKLIKK